MPFDPIANDVPFDPEFPASNSGFAFRVPTGELLNGVLYHPVGAGPHPLMIIVHGIPGHERNHDLAQIVRRAGWHTLVFHPRGAWGSEGDYRFSHILEDTQAILEHFRQPEVAENYRIDAQRIVLAGHSLGAWVTLMLVAHGVVDQAIAWGTANVGVWFHMVNEASAEQRQMFLEMFGQNIAPLNGVTENDLLEELLAYGMKWDLPQLAQHLRHARVLLIGAKRDNDCPVFDHHVPLVKALEAVNAPHFRHALMATDHSFNDARIALARAILEWLG